MTSKDRRRRRKLRPQPRPRRGVLLLVVLSLLVLFLLVGTTFLLIGGQYRTASEAVEEANRTTFQPADVLERVLMQVVRDTQNRHSALRYHSLLRDLYGGDGFVGRVFRRSDVLNEGAPPLIGLIDNDGVTTNDELPISPRYVGANPTVAFGATNDGLGITRGQAIEFFVVDVQNPNDPASRLSESNAVGVDFDEAGLPVEHTVSPTSGYYEGCVLTFLEGPCRGQSVRVLGYDVLPARLGTALTGFEVTVSRWRVTAPTRADGSPLSLGTIEFRADPENPASMNLATQFGLTDLVQDAALGVRFLVNGRPFNGAGVGLNPLAMSHDLDNGSPAPRNSALEAVQVSGTPFVFGLETALTPNSTYFNFDLVAALRQNRHTDPFASGLVNDLSNPTDPANDFVFLNTQGDVNLTPRPFPQYRTFAGPGDTDESYDAADYQNMALASQPLERRLRGRVATLDTNGQVVLLDPDAHYVDEDTAPNRPAPLHLDLDGVPIPSLHRPSLSNFWFHRLFNSEWLTTLVADPSQRVRAILQPYNAQGAPQNGLSAATASQITAIKRKFMMRPLREDHPGFDGSNPLSRYSTGALRAALNGTALVNPRDPDNPLDDEITFPFWEAVGPWDVDNDGDGVPDSVWVDLGLPVQQTEDGRFYKPLVALLIEDLDGRLNLNAHGATSDLATADVLRSSPVIAANPNFNTQDLDQSSGAVVNRNLAQDYTGSPALVSSNQLPPGDGWGTAEVSLRSLLSPTLPLDELVGGSSGPNSPNGNPLDVGYAGNPQYDDYARLLFGRPDPADPGFRDRAVAAPLREQTTFGRYGSAAGSTTLLPLTGPGVTLTGVPLGGATQTSRDRLTPQEFSQWPVFTDAIGASRNFSAPGNEPLSGFSSPPNLASRYVGAGVTATGAPVNEAYDEARAATVIARVESGNASYLGSWRELFFAGVDDSPYELNLASNARRVPPSSLSGVTESYLATTPLSDDSPFSPAELERLLRAFDADAETLPDRLWRTLDAVDPAKLAAATDLNEQIALGDGQNSPDFVNGVLPNSLQRVVAAARAAINRRQMTTDSWDLPTPNENWTERLILGADGFPGVRWEDVNLDARRFNTSPNDGDPNNDPTNTIDPADGGDLGDDDDDGLFDEGDEAIAFFNPSGIHTFSTGLTLNYDELFAANCDDYVVVMRDDPPSPGRITDYLRYRVVLELKRQGLVDADVAHDDPTIDPARIRLDGLSLPQAVNNIIFGDSTIPAGDPRLATNRHSFGGLLAPELLAGLRMDLNRPFGDGRDNGDGVDNNNNGLIDDITEFFNRNGLDDDNDGLVDEVDEGVDPFMNGVVDDPAEAGEPFVDLNGNGIRDDGEPFQNLNRSFVDNNDNGRLDPGEETYNPPLDRVLVTDLNNNGVVDQGDTTAPFNYTRGAFATGRGSFIDDGSGATSTDGVYDPGEPIVRDDSRMARQLFARHLYVLMLLLTDENYLAPYDAEDLQVRHYIDPLSGERGVVGLITSPRLWLTQQSEAFRLAAQTHLSVLADEIAAGIVTTDHTLPIPLALVDSDTGRALEETRLGALNQARQQALRKLTRRRIAQWAINVVDFRDPDSIQTPFEYDENPWDGWNVVGRNRNNTFGDPTDDTFVIVPLDGDLTTDETYLQRRAAGPGGLTAPTPDAASIDIAATLPSDRTRGVVWGAERPELLLSEGVAWHDRRLDDETRTETNPDEEAPDFEDGLVVNNGQGAQDDDLDQLRLPKGNVFLEVTNPWIGDTQRPAELYSHVDRDGAVTPREAGVRLDRVSNVAQDPNNSVNTRSPVWRISCIEEHPLLRNTSIDPDVDPGLGTPISDDQINGVTAGDNRRDYFDVTMAHGPWIYESNLANDNFGVPVRPEPLPQLSSAYLDWIDEKGIELRFALMTELADAAGSTSADADGVRVPTGVIERPPTVPDPTFPAFDRFAQPRDPASGPVTATLSVSSTIDVADSGREDLIRQVKLKPTRFLERIFYLAPAVNTVVDRERGQELPIADLTNPGYRVPDLGYTIPLVQTVPPARLEVEGPLSGATLDPSGDQAVRVLASKFANGFDRMDVDRDNDTFDLIEFAPILPGRMAVLGTTGEVYTDTRTNVAVDPTFLDTDAGLLAERYATIHSQTTSIVTVKDRRASYALVRRMEMLPSPNPNKHQFAVRMNGLNESLTTLDAGGGAYNVGAGEAFGLDGVLGTADDNPTLLTGPPVVAIPIDHFSISEPLDQYLVRQLELDPNLSVRLRRNFGQRRFPNNAPIEDYFGDAQGRDLHFDEPFDLLPELIENQTTPNYRSLHLERLANPQLPWNPPPTRPSGEEIAQHDPTLPVNPYLPVDARALDLTAYNSFDVGETRLGDGSNSPPEVVRPLPAGDARGPEERHRRRRGLPGDNLAIGATAPPQSAIGFVSNERDRPLGPFPGLWLAEPARLLWRQAGGSTLSEIAHNFTAPNRSHNGYRAGDQDQITKNGGTITTAGVAHDLRLLRAANADGGYQDHTVDFPLRMTLGFASWAVGEVFGGSGLRWFADALPGNPPPQDTPAELIDIDGDRLQGELAGRPEVADFGPTAFADTDSDGQPNVVAGFTPLNQAGNARDFFETYLRQRALAERTTTPAFPWPNRPLASAGELLQVPVWGGSRMLTYYSVFDWQHHRLPFFENRQQANPYNGEAGIGFDHDGLDYDPGNRGGPRGPLDFDGDFGNDIGTAIRQVVVPPRGVGEPYSGSRLIVDLDGRPEEGATNRLRWRETLGHFGHLANFFQTARFPSYTLAFARVIDLGADMAAGGEDANADEIEEYVVPVGAPHFYRLLDYVHTPSRFTATDTLLNVGTFSPPDLAPDDVRREFSAPFNRTANYREPGRVNLNTIPGRGDAAEPADRWSEVYDGLMHRVQDASTIDYDANRLLQMGHLGPAWRDVELSRRGYVQPDFDPTTNGGDAVDYSPGRLHPDFPTRVANPFRAPGEGANVPLVGMVQTGVDATLLRAHPLSPGADGAWGARGFDEAGVDKSGDGVVNTHSAAIQVDTDRIRDDASEAGLVTFDVAGALVTQGATLEVGGGTQAVASQPPGIRLQADVVLADLQADGRRGRVPDSLLEDAFRSSLADVNPRNVTAVESRAPDTLLDPAFTNQISNAEISKRATAVPLFSGASLEPSLDTERNSTTRYQPIQRLANLATTRSNVYAIWITVGFFEVTPAQQTIGNLTDTSPGSNDGRYFNNDGSFKSPDLEELFFQVYPDGLTLGAELGFDDGTNRRHRGFYVVDRSLPVGFRPGEDVNASETVLVRRRIE